MKTVEDILSDKIESVIAKEYLKRKTMPWIKRFSLVLVGAVAGFIATPTARNYAQHQYEIRMLRHQVDTEHAKVEKVEAEYSTLEQRFRYMVEDKEKAEHGFNNSQKLLDQGASVIMKLDGEYQKLKVDYDRLVKDQSYFDTHVEPYNYGNNQQAFRMVRRQ